MTGVAWTGTGTVSQVEISTDGGRSWQPARFTTEARPGTWRLWEADVAIGSAGEQRLRARATDTAGTRSPSGHAQPGRLWEQLDPRGARRCALKPGGGRDARSRGACWPAC